MKNFTLSLLILFSFQNAYSQSWTQVGSGVNLAVRDLIVYNSNLIIAGDFSAPGNGIVKWDGNNYQSFGSGVDTAVNCLDTASGNLYAGGNFTVMDLVPANNIAMWNGTNWSALGSGTNGPILCMTFYQGELYVGGKFTMAGNIPVNNIAKWNGSVWSDVGGGLSCQSCQFGFAPQVSSLCVYNNELYAGGFFNVPGNNIMKWNGNSWSVLGAGVDYAVFTMIVYNNELIVSGTFSHVNNINCMGLAAWNGSWQFPFGSSATPFWAMSVINGSFYLGGCLPVYSSFAQSNGTSLNYIWTNYPINTCTFYFSGAIVAIEKFNNSIYLGGCFQAPCGAAADWLMYIPQTSLGTNDLSVKNNFSVSPNPSSGKFVVDIKELQSQKYFISVTDVLGREILKKEVSDQKNEIDLSNSPNGIYYLFIRSGSAVLGSAKLVKQQ